MTNLVAGRRRNRPTVFDLWGQLDRELDTWFNENGAAPGEGRFSPACDVRESDKNYHLRFDLPGIPQENLNIEVRDGHLIVSGERKIEETKEGEGWQRVERSFGRFERSFMLPKGAKVDDIRADYTDGVLELDIPKREDEQPRRIAVNRTTHA